MSHRLMQTCIKYLWSQFINDYWVLEFLTYLVSCFQVLDWSHNTEKSDLHLRRDNPSHLHTPHFELIPKTTPILQWESWERPSQEYSAPLTHLPPETIKKCYYKHQNHRRWLQTCNWKGEIYMHQNIYIKISDYSVNFSSKWQWFYGGGGGGGRV